MIDRSCLAIMKKATVPMMTTTTLIELDSWADLTTAIESTTVNGARRIYRGVTNQDHKLITKLGRLGTRKNPENGEKTACWNKHCARESVG